MGRPESRERPPARLKPVKAWAVVDFDGKIAMAGHVPLVYTRRHVARMVAGKDGDRVVPVEIRSLQHKRR